MPPPRRAPARPWRRRGVLLLALLAAAAATPAAGDAAAAGGSGTPSQLQPQQDAAPSLAPPRGGCASLCAKPQAARAQALAWLAGALGSGDGALRVTGAALEGPCAALAFCAAPAAGAAPGAPAAQQVGVVLSSAQLAAPAGPAAAGDAAAELRLDVSVAEGGPFFSHLSLRCAVSSGGGPAPQVWLEPRGEWADHQRRDVLGAALQQAAPAGPGGGGGDLGAGGAAAAAWRSDDAPAEVRAPRRAPPALAERAGGARRTAERRQRAAAGPQVLSTSPFPVAAGGSYTLTLRLPARDGSAGGAGARILLLPGALQLAEPHAGAGAGGGARGRQSAGERQEPVPVPEREQEQEPEQQEPEQQQGQPGSVVVSSALADAAEAAMMAAPPPAGSAMAGAPPLPEAAGGDSFAAARAPPFLAPPLLAPSLAAGAAAPPLPPPSAEAGVAAGSGGGGGGARPAPEQHAHQRAPPPFAPALPPAPSTAAPAPPPALSTAAPAPPPYHTGNGGAGQLGPLPAAARGEGAAAGNEGAAAARRLQVSLFGWDDDAAGADAVGGDASSAQPGPDVLALLAGLDPGDAAAARGGGARTIPLERGRLPFDGPDPLPYARLAGEPFGRTIWGLPPPPPLAAVAAAAAPAPAAGRKTAVRVQSAEDWPVPIITLPNDGIVSLSAASTLLLDGSWSLASAADPLVSWTWALRMISPREADLTSSVRQDVTEPTAYVSLTTPGSYVVGLTVESEAGVAHWNNSALIVVAGDVPIMPGAGTPENGGLQAAPGRAPGDAGPTAPPPPPRPPPPPSPPPSPPPPPFPPTVPLCYFTTNGQLPFPAVAPQNLPQYPNAAYNPNTGTVVPEIPTQQFIRHATQSLGAVGQGVVNQVGSLGNQVSAGLANSAGQSVGNLAAGGLYGLGQAGMSGLSAGLFAGARLAGGDGAEPAAGGADSGAGGGLFGRLGARQGRSLQLGGDAGAQLGAGGGAGGGAVAPGLSAEELESSAARGLQQLASWMTNPEMTNFGMGAINSGGLQNFAADYGLGGGLGGALGGLGGALGGLGGGLGGGLPGLAGLAGGGGLAGLAGGGGLAGLAGGAGGLAGLAGGAGGLAGLAGGGGLPGLGLGAGGGGLPGLGALPGLGGGGLPGLGLGAGARSGGGLGGLLGALKPGGRGQTPVAAAGPAPAQPTGASSAAASPFGGALRGWEQAPAGGAAASAAPSGGAAAAGVAGGAAPYNPYASVQYDQQFAQLAAVPGQAKGALMGYGTGLTSQGLTSAVDLGKTLTQQAASSLAAPGQPLLGGNQQPAVVPGLAQDPNTYLLGGSDYYAGGSSGVGQAGAGGPASGTAYTPGQGALTGGQLVSSTNIGEQYAGGQLGTGGGFVGSNPNPGGAFDPSTGQFTASPPGQGAVPGGFYWSGGYWGYCPPPAPPGPGPASPPPPPGNTFAVIKSPQPLSEWSTGPTGLAQVLLDAGGSAPAPGRRIVAYGWVVKSAIDGTPKATATGATATVLLPPGQYVASVNVVDNTGASATQGPVRFVVGGAGQSGGDGIGPNAVMVAVIKSPAPIVLAAPDGGNKSIPLDATGSTPSPGHLIKRYVWTVTTQQAGGQVVLLNQTAAAPNVAFVSLPVGSYIVSLTIEDTSGRNASIVQNFVVAGGTEGGLIAVITQPQSYVPASPGGWTTVLLDAQNSSPKPGSTINQYVWAIVDRVNLTTDGKPTPVANATGRFAQVGLLLLDSANNNAIAQKNFVIGPMPPLPPGQIPYTDNPRPPAPPPSPRPGEQSPPEIPALVAPLDGESGGRVALPTITDPNGDPVDVKWDLKSGDAVVRSGAGSVVSLLNVPPGSYTILVTASDGRLTSTGTYELRVRRGTVPAPPPPPPPPPAPVPLDIDLRLPSLTLSQGAVLEIDAGSTGVPFRNLTSLTYRWALKSKATGQTVVAKEGQHVSLPLDEAESLALSLNVSEPRTSRTASGASNLKIIPLPEGAPALPRMTGTCPPFKSNPASDTVLSCPGLKALSPDGAPSGDELVWAWRITRADTQKITTQVGKAPNFGRLPQANYIVEAAVGHKGPPTSANTIYFLSSYLVVSPTNPPSAPAGAAGAPPGAAAGAPAGAPRPPSPMPKPPSPAPKPPAGRRPRRAALAAAAIFAVLCAAGAQGARAPASAAAAWALVQGGGGGGDAPGCFEEDCRSSPFIMHPARQGNGSANGTVEACFAFVAIGCYASPKGCCPAVARRFTGLEFSINPGCDGSVLGVSLNRVPLPSWEVTKSAAGPRLVVGHLGMDFFDVGDAQLCVTLDAGSACPYWGALCAYDGGKCAYRILGGRGRRGCCMACELYGGVAPGGGGDAPAAAAAAAAAAVAAAAATTVAAAAAAAVAAAAAAAAEVGAALAGGRGRGGCRRSPRSRCGGGRGGGGGGGKLVTIRRTRRWRAANGVTYEEEEELVHMNAGSGGNSSARPQALALPRRAAGSSLRLGGLLEGEGAQDADRVQAAAAAAAAAGGGAPTGGSMFWHRGGGGFSWSWRRSSKRRA
ncbi:hypothetical protein HT031_003080 [Scenedesmus sp. PABB004]|nr:hypothetical protein HT031_003080 [Scenedesmus sp. PABB004]